MSIDLRGKEMMKEICQNKSNEFQHEDILINSFHSEEYFLGKNEPHKYYIFQIFTKLVWEQHYIFYSEWKNNAHV